MKSHFTEIYDVTEIVTYNFRLGKCTPFARSNYAGRLWGEVIYMWQILTYESSYEVRTDSRDHA